MKEEGEGERAHSIGPFLTLSLPLPLPISFHSAHTTILMKIGHNHMPERSGVPPGPIANLTLLALNVI